MTRTMLSRTTAVLLPLAFPAAAQADEPAAQPDCSVVAPPPAELAAWARPIPLAAGPDPARQPSLAIGQAADVALVPTQQVTYAPRPEKPGGPVSFGGLIALDVAEAGTYRVALGSGAWIDLVRGARAATSTAHGHGPACSGVRKMVDFALIPGRYALQLSGNPVDRTRVLVVRLP